jgi:hypothetical protein
MPVKRRDHGGEPVPTGIAEIERRLWSAAEELRANSGLKGAVAASSIAMSPICSRGQPATLLIGDNLGG